MDIKELFSDIWPLLIIAFSVWSAINENKKKKRAAENKRQAGTSHSLATPQRIDEPSDSPWAALLSDEFDILKSLKATPEGDDASHTTPTNSEYSATYSYTGGSEPTPHLQTQNSTAQTAKSTTEAEGTAAVKIDPEILKTFEAEREAAIMRRRQRRATLRRAIIWSETLPPKFR